MNAAGALAAAGRLAAAPAPAAGFASSSHYGGGESAIPAAPVAPRGPAGLILCCLLAAGCLAVIALATGRLMAVRDSRAGSSGPPYEPVPPAGPSGRDEPDQGDQPPHAHFLPAPPARHAAPRNRRAP